MIILAKKEKIFDRDINITDDKIGGLPFDEVTRSYAEPMKKIEQPDKSILIDGDALLGTNFTKKGKKKKGKKAKKKSQGIKWI